jgi:hypothetical protein
MKFLAVLVIAIAGIWGLALGFGNPTYTYRYRLTLEVEVDGQVRAGSSVVEVKSFASSGWGLQPYYKLQTLTGEATLVDLGKDQVLVALLEGVLEDGRLDRRHGREWVGVGPTGLLSKLYGTSLEWFKERSPGMNELTQKRGLRELQPNQLPTLLAFRDANDPKSAFVVDPSDLAAAFGSSVRLMKATIEIVDANVTSGIEKKLPWLKATKGYLNGQSACIGHLSQELPFCPDRLHLIRANI